MTLRATNGLTQKWPTNFQNGTMPASWLPQFPPGSTLCLEEVLDPLKKEATGLGADLSMTPMCSMLTRKNGS